MTQSLWEPEVVEDAAEQAADTSFEPIEDPIEQSLEDQIEEQIEAKVEETVETPVAAPVAESVAVAAEPEQAEVAVAEPESEPAAAAQVSVSLSADEFSALEVRILRAVDLVKRERAARIAAEENIAAAEALLTSQAVNVDELQKEVEGLRAERDQVRQRVEKLLGELDALEM